MGRNYYRDIPDSPSAIKKKTLTERKKKKHF